MSSSLIASFLFLGKCSIRFGEEDLFFIVIIIIKPEEKKNDECLKLVDGCIFNEQEMTREIECDRFLFSREERILSMNSR